MAERDLPGVAGEDVEAQERDEVDPDVRVVARLEVAHELRQDENEDRERREGDEADRPPCARAHR